MRSRSRSRSRSVTTYSDASYERARGELSRSRSRSRSRSPSPVRHGGGMDERFRSRSPVPPPRRRSPSPALRRRSPSPAYRRGGGDRGGGGGGRTWDRGGPSVRRYNDGREAPKPNRCLGVFGLGLDTREEDLREIFGKYGQLEKVELVYDRESHRSRGFGFIYFERLDDAVEAKARLSGEEIDGHRARVDFSVTKRAHSPTPGVYMGAPDGRPRPTRDNSEGYYADRGGSRNNYQGGRGRDDYQGGRGRDDYQGGRGRDDYQGSRDRRYKSPSPARYRRRSASYEDRGYGSRNRRSPSPRGNRRSPSPRGGGYYDRRNRY